MMKNILILALLGVAEVVRVDDYPGNPNFRNVAVTNAAQYRTDWRTNAFDWATAQTLGEGIDYLPVVLTERGGWARRMVCHVTRIDTAKPNVRFTGIDRCPSGYGEPQKAGSKYRKSVVLEKTGDLMARFRGSAAKGGKARDMRVAFNSSGWSPWPSETPWGQIGNVCYSDGVQVSVAHHGQSGYCPGVFVAWKDGTVDIVDSLASNQMNRVWYAITPVFCRLVTDGEITVVHYRDDTVGNELVPYEPSLFDRIRPRTAIGISADKRYCYVLVMDGDTYNVDVTKNWSAGATLDDAAKVMKLVGCHQAFNLDGGGSSNMVGWDASSARPMVLGHPKDSGAVDKTDFSAMAQRDGGCHGGVYLAPILVTVGTWRYDDADVLVQDIADGEMPANERTVDVLGDLTFSAERPTLPSGSDWTFVSTNGATLAWADGKGRVGAGSRITFTNIAFAASSRTLAVEKGGRAVLRCGADLDRIETVDADGFVLGGPLAKPLTVDCAAAMTEDAVFGRSELSYEDTLVQLPNLRPAGEPSFVATAVETRDGIDLKWGLVSFGPPSVRVKKDDRTAIVSIDVAAVSPDCLGTGNRLALTVTSDDGTETNEFSQALTGTGRYDFRVQGAGFGYSFEAALVDAAGSAVAQADVQRGVFTFGVENVWFAAEPPTGAVTGGRWMSATDFAADESVTGGKVRIISELTVDAQDAADAALAARRLADLSADGLPQAMLLLGTGDGERCPWSGLVRKNGVAVWERLTGGEVPAAAGEAEWTLVEEVDFSSGRPRVRYFAGPKASGAAVLLSDASGATAFDGIGESSVVRGNVGYTDVDEIRALTGFRRVKNPQQTGFAISIKGETK